MMEPFEKGWKEMIAVLSDRMRADPSSALPLSSEESAKSQIGREMIAAERRKAGLGGQCNSCGADCLVCGKR